jgi:hypothetical protein
VSTQVLPDPDLIGQLDTVLETMKGTEETTKEISESELRTSFGQTPTGAALAGDGNKGIEGNEPRSISPIPVSPNSPNIPTSGTGNQESEDAVVRDETVVSGSLLPFTETETQRISL